ncbi:cell wall hydrolase [Aminipila butyrica]|uniref:Cell wall hydrolase n=1 Tax=Aminipila butyrica TaxID=433296 RepID=A0A858BQX2_9FIRM|nr:cell wall hydrolase [Aminipila butyrica]QIB68233.1 cell wall hydrolase [Aminipila butyrica]
MDRRTKRLICLLCALMLVQPVYYIGIAYQLCKVKLIQEDTLNTLVDVEHQIDDLSLQNSHVDNLLDEANKNVSQGSEKTAKLSQSDREHIQRVCMAEAGADITGLMAVAQTIHNRAALWNMDPIEVVTQDGQYAPPREGEIYPEAVQAVWAVFDEGMRAFDGDNVTHFYSGEAEPYWTDGKEYVGSRGGNRFYR